MSQTKANLGFTLIELLVVLAIIGMLASVMAPATFSILESRERALLKDELKHQFALMPQRAFNENRKIIIQNSNDLKLNTKISVSIDKPIVILKNGYCLGGDISATIDERVSKYQVIKPSCQVREYR